MDRPIKPRREQQLETEIRQLKSENARLQDCLLLQQKIIEKERKQKLFFMEFHRKSLDDETRSHPYEKLRKSVANEGQSTRLLKRLTSREEDVDISGQSGHSQNDHVRSANNDSRKTVEEQVNGSLKEAKSTKKLLTLKQLKAIDSTSTSACLYKPQRNDVLRRKSYLQKLVEKISDT